MGSQLHESNPELESFRAQWRAEVLAKTTLRASQDPTASDSSDANQSSLPFQATESRWAAGKRPGAQDSDEADAEVSYDKPKPPVDDEIRAAVEPGVWGSREPVTALDHYEKAVEREVAGSLGDSMALYRTAFRMDDGVDRKYRNKHFPKVAASQSAVAGPSESASLGPIEQSSQNQAPQNVELPMKELVASFGGLRIEPTQTPVEGDPQPPCPISGLPDELLIQILQELAILDVGDFVRLSCVCKHMAYLVATENSIWRCICLGSEFGFAAMHHHWQSQVTWRSLPCENLPRRAPRPDDEGSEETDGDFLSIEDRRRKHAVMAFNRTMDLYKSVYKSSWQRMFRHRPRIRFNGCYISTSNYIRSGQASSSQTTWSTPVHIVTYYRYLRFFRDGTAISLLSTSEPVDIVRRLTRESACAEHLAASSQSAYRGRWRFTDAQVGTEAEGNVCVETVGVGKYLYRLDLSLRSARNGSTRNNKLVWRGHYSYDTLTDDWGVFNLRNDKPFFFSRVVSYGNGEE